MKIKNKQINKWIIQGTGLVAALSSIAKECWIGATTFNHMTQTTNEHRAYFGSWEPCIASCVIVNLPIEGNPEPKTGELLYLRARIYQSQSWRQMPEKSEVLPWDAEWYESMVSQREFPQNELISCWASENS